MLDMQRMKGQSEGLEDKKKFYQYLHEMKYNKHFREYLKFHDKSLQNGLIKLDRDLHTKNYFEKMFMEHLDKNNKYRTLNKEVFDFIKKDKALDKTQA